MADAKGNRYAYTARDASGATRTGIIQADSQTAAAKRLQAMGLAPLAIRAENGGGKKGGGLSFGGKNKKVKAKTLSQFARQFSTMIEAGLPLIRILSVLSDQADHVTMQRTLPLVRADVESGQSLSTAFARHPMVFPPLMIGMIAAGEVSGSLGGAMNLVANNYEREASLRSKIISALMYPMVVLGMAVLMVIAMLLFVVPTFVGVFSSLGGDLPLPTQILVSLSESAKYFVPVMVVGAIGFGRWWRSHGQDRAIRKVIDPLKLKMPVFGKFFQKIAVARFSRTFSSLLTSGVPMLQTLDIVAATSGSLVVSEALQDVREAVRGGKPVASTMADHDVFPTLVVQMISTGEETGSMGEMLDKVADFYEGEVDTAAATLTSVLEPIMIVFLAAIVGGMVVALYMPMFSVFNLIE